MYPVDLTSWQTRRWALSLLFAVNLWFGTIGGCPGPTHTVILKHCDIRSLPEFVTPVKETSDLAKKFQKTDWITDCVAAEINCRQVFESLIKVLCTANQDGEGGAYLNCKRSNSNCNCPVCLIDHRPGNPRPHLFPLFLKTLGSTSEALCLVIHIPRRDRLIWVEGLRLAGKPLSGYKLNATSSETVVMLIASRFSSFTIWCTLTDNVCFMHIRCQKMQTDSEGERWPGFNRCWKIQCGSLGLETLA